MFILRPKLRNLLTIQTVKPYPKWLISLNTVDSTNNYAIKLIEDGLALHGNVVWTLEQTAGKGQRGKMWETNIGENVMMSIIIQPKDNTITNLFHLNILIAQTICSYFNNLYQHWQVKIKWPNDIYINDKKTAGILIENVFRGSDLSHMVIGLGINTNQSNFPIHLTRATSLKLESGLSFDLLELITDLRAGILNTIAQYHPSNFEKTLIAYNKNLLGMGKKLRFQLQENDEIFEAIVEKVDSSGQLFLKTNEGVIAFNSGSLIWHF